ncbi:MAG: tRNA (N(6)-L-threonylcarbamoyladenosine(37)-C(2))-methylthiotransferase MtaB [Anaerolineae bacterium]
MRVFLDSLGCRLNTAETEALAASFAGAGHEIVSSLEDAQLLVLNTCAVTAQAVRKSRHTLRRWQRRNPKASIAAVGCWATADAGAVARLPNIEWILPNVEKERAVAIITGEEPSPAPWYPGRWGHTRAFLGVQDGCDAACTYCITRVLRGPARSRPLNEVLSKVQALVAQGAQEVVLTGVSLGSYGRDLGLEEGLAMLVALLLDATHLPRLRLSSIEPWDVTEELLRQWEDPRLCCQLHIPLQAGVDHLLRRMGRPITTEMFADLVTRARSFSPAMAVTTDVLVGFPGETDAFFEESLAFVEEMGFARLHVFPYSERAGTPAVRLKGRLPRRVRKDRARRMRELGESLASRYRERFVGEVLPVLWERRNAAGRWRGWTDNYLAVITESELPLFNRVTPVQVLDVEGRRLRGRVVENTI